MSSGTRVADGARYRRPLVLAIAAAMFGELAIFLIFGVVLYPAGSILSKFLWTVVFCGIGMGAALGAAVSLFVVDRFDGARAIGATTVLSVLMLGLACDLLCLELDKHFEFFGGHEMPTLFLLNGVVMSLVGGLAIGSALFTVRGRNLLDRLGI